MAAQKQVSPKKFEKARENLQRAGQLLDMPDGNLSEAEALCKKALKVFPEEILALTIMALIYLRQDKFISAERVLKKILGAEPENVTALKHLAWLKEKQGAFDEAISGYEKAIEHTPNDADILFNLGILYQKKGRKTDALAVYKRSVDNGGRPEAQFNYGLLLSETNDPEQSVEILFNLLKENPKDDRTMSQLSIALKGLGRHKDAIDMSVQALAHNPDEITHQGVFIQNLRNYRVREFDNGLYQSLHFCLAEGKTNCVNAYWAWHGLLFSNPEFSALADAVEAELDQVRTGEFDLESLKECLEHSYLLLGLQNLVILDHGFEALLVAIRHRVLRTLHDGDTSLAVHFGDFLCALAEECFFNEYVFDVSSEEEEMLRDLMPRLEAMDSASEENEAFVALMACYIPLIGVKTKKAKLEDIFASSKRAALQGMIRTQILEPKKEIELRASIRSLGNIDDDVSKAVREQYEENPYPRWKIANMYKYHEGESKTSYDEMDLLVAGCGTGQHVLQTVIQYSKAHVTALDLSLASLAYAKRKIDEYGVKNIDFVHGDILNVAELGKQYDRIESCGVLHHMDDPMAGWRALTDILKPGGTMKIALYSELARQSIVEMRDIIKKEGFDSTLKGIRQARQYAISSDSPELKMLSTFRDFCSTSMCRDLIFHVQEHRFTVPQIKKCLEDLGLEMVGFDVFQADYRIKYNELYPDDPAIKNLDYVDEFERKYPMMFKSMYQFELVKPS